MRPDVSGYVEGWRRRLLEEGELRKRRRDELVARLRPVAARFAREFGVPRVILFGSAAEGRTRPGSDVDLAVQGLAPDRYLAALRFLEREIGPDVVDLIEYETAGPSLKLRIDAGIVLHG
jgi:predicted nucleotidyltransferase